MRYQPPGAAPRSPHTASVLVVGAGLCGATVARCLADGGVSVRIIDRRPHLAGNAHDEINRHGIRQHRYGPHLFHTNNRRVYNHLSRFTKWLPYRHRVQALHRGRYLTLPPNRETRAILGEERIVDVLFRPYTRKMWGCDIEELSPDILRRVPVRDDMNVWYFPKDRIQCLPERGYTAMVQAMLDHPAISVSLDTAFAHSMESGYDHVFNSMAIDEYYGYRYGELPYRSIRFRTVHRPVAWVHRVATTNFTTARGPTRVTEWKRLPGHGDNPHCTSLTFETPCDYRHNNRERYYPVKDLAGDNRRLYRRYQAIPNPRTTFIGRCGKYVYIDMDQAVSMGLQTARRWLRSPPVALCTRQ